MVGVFFFVWRGVRGWGWRGGRGEWGFGLLCGLFVGVFVFDGGGSWVGVGEVGGGVGGVGLEGGWWVKVLRCGRADFFVVGMGGGGGVCDVSLFREGVFV